MSDRELLELAAKAAGYSVRWHDIWKCFVHCGPHNIHNPPTPSGDRHVWVPLSDDGDALRLAIKLGICISFIPECDTVQVFQERTTTGEPFNVHTGGQGDVETRLVIVQAAAEIGRSLP